MSVEVVPEQLRAASRAARNLAEQLGGTNVWAPVDAVEAWMRASYSAASSETLANTWRTRVADLARDIDLHATTLSTAAGDFQATDGDNARALPRPAQ